MAALPHSIEDALLSAIAEFDGIESTLAFASDKGLEHGEVVSALKRLEAKLIVLSEVREQAGLRLSKEGEEAVSLGSPEYRLFKHLPPEGIPQADLQNLPFGDAGFGNARMKGWIKLVDIEGKKYIQRNVTEDKAIDETRAYLQQVVASGGDPKVAIPDKVMLVLKKKRKLIVDEKVKFFRVRKGPNFGKNVEYETDLTHELIKSGKWKDKSFKDYNFKALGIRPSGGHLHPLLKVRSEFREIFLEMGFEEMPTNNFVESSFWNFDALFQPQQHPARDAHDTFFLSDPEFADEKLFPADYVQRVKDMHERGSEESGSIGYRYDWKLSEAKKNILRTHTTAVSTRMLYRLAQQKEFKPVRYFSIDRVFRNEKLDATHLAEFHQIEGLVADYNLTLGDLIGTITEFFNRLGLKDLRFKPAYNPYTEPSMEVFGYNRSLKRWLEVGNSGVFRPEMLLPMGLPKDVRVIAWGLSLERPTMNKYNISNIRDLVGHKVPLGFVQDNPIPRFF